LYKPLPLSWITGLIGYFSNKMPLFFNTDKTIGNGEGREGFLYFHIVVRVSSYGSVNVKFNVKILNMEKFGYRAI
jgi:hypothetical protein